MMVAVDTNVLIALVDRRDALHDKAIADLKRVVGRRLVVTLPVLTEAAFGLPARHHRARLRAILREFAIGILTAPDASTDDVFAWLERYHDHEPDWADGHLAVASGLDKALRIWTYDREFTRVWRRPDGTRIPLVTKN